MERICAFCGATYTPKHTIQKYCCHKCHGKASWQVQKQKPKPSRICQYCGATYQTSSQTSKYCSRGCAGKARTPVKIKSLEIDHSTAYDCQKWNREGMSPAAIAKMTHRTVEFVQRALAVKLDKADYAMMAEYRR